MRVLYVIPGNIKDGEISYSNLIRREISYLEKEGITFETFFFVNRKSISALLDSKKKLEKQIQLFNPDIVHVYTGSSTTLLVALAKKKCPWIITFGGSDLLGYHRKGFIWKLRSKLAVYLSFFSARKSDGIICVSENLQDALRENGNITDKNIQIIPRGIDLETFRVIDKLQARKELEISESSNVILFSQNRDNAVVKNWILAEEVLMKLRDFYKIEFEVVKLINLTTEQIVLYLNAANAILFTSLHEGSPNIIKEAMACNLPVISVNCGDVKDRLTNVTDSKVLGYDSEELAKHLVNVLKNAPAGNGRLELIAQKLDSDSVAKKIIAYYKFIVKRK